MGSWGARPTSRWSSAPPPTPSWPSRRVSGERYLPSPRPGATAPSARPRAPCSLRGQPSERRLSAARSRDARPAPRARVGPATGRLGGRGRGGGRGGATRGEGPSLPRTFLPAQDRSELLRARSLLAANKNLVGAPGGTTLGGQLWGTTTELELQIPSASPYFFSIHSVRGGVWALNRGGPCSLEVFSCRCWGWGDAGNK